MHAILFAAAAVAATIVAPEPPSDGYHYETVTLAPQVHVLVRPDPVRAPFEGNITVIEQSDGLVVVDAGGAPIGGQRAVAAIKAFSRKPVKFVIFTHWHPDHHLGAPAFKAAYPGVHFVTTPATRDAMIKVLIPISKDYAKNFAPTGAFAAKRAADSALSDTERRRYAQLAADAPLITKAYQGVTLTLPDVTFTDRLSLPDTDAPVEVLFLGRGNTEGDAVTFLPRQKVIVTGDLVVAPYPYGAESYPAEWIAVLKKLEGFDFTTLVPGHGENPARPHIRRRGHCAHRGHAGADRSAGCQEDGPR